MSKMSTLEQPVISAALTRAQELNTKHSTALQDMLGSTLVQKEVPTETEVPVAKPKRTRKKTVD